MHPVTRIIFLACLLFIAACSTQTKKLLVNKTWKVIDVQVPKEIPFDVQNYDQAAALKNGFYKNASFEFKPDGTFIATFQNKPDTGRYRVTNNGHSVELRPQKGNKVYEHLEIVEISQEELAFKTLIDKDFKFILLCKPAS